MGKLHNKRIPPSNAGPQIAGPQWRIWLASIFGNLAILAMSIDRAVDPWALRHRLSPILPFSIGAYSFYKQYCIQAGFAEKGLF
jgi:hypothetical protein